MADTTPKPQDTRHTVTHLLVLVILVAVAGALPFALVSVVRDVHDQAAGIHFVTNQSGAADAPYRLHLELTSLSESEGTVGLRATARRLCLPSCQEAVQLTLLTAIAPTTEPENWLPVSESITFPPGRDAISQQVRLPAYGDPIRYPFDRWLFGVLVIPQRVLADGGLEPVRDARLDELAITLQSRIPRLVVSPSPE